MTSKISYHKFARIDLRQRGWLIALTSILFLFLLPVAYLLELQNVSTVDSLVSDISRIEAEREVANQIRQVVQNVMGLSNSYVLFGIGLIAVLCAVTGFSYLHSHTKTDFYMSLPIDRRHMFRIFYVNGILIGMVPYVLCVLVAAVPVGAAGGAFTGGYIAYSLGTMAVNVLAFLSIYSICVLGMILTGRNLDGILFSAIIMLYLPVCYIAFTSFMETLFQTWIAFYDGISGRIASISPLMLMLYAEDVARWKAALVFLAYFVVVTVLDVVLYRLRPAEAAGNALSWRQLQSIVKAAVSIPGAVLFGYLMYQVSSQNYYGWFVFGVLAGSILLAGIFEFIFTGDLRNLWRHRISGIVILASAIAVIGIGVAGPRIYDTWLPEKGKIASISLYSDSGQRDLFDFYADMNVEKAILETSGTEQTDSLYQLAREGAAEAEKKNKDGSYVTVDIRYALTDGSVRYRRYQVKEKTLETTAERLSDSREWREQNYILRWVNAKDIDSISFSDWNDLSGNSEDLTLNAQEKEELLNLLKNESVNLSLADAASTEPVAYLQVFMESDESSYNSVLSGIIGSASTGNQAGVELNTIYVYPSYTGTLAFLKAHGAERKTEAEQREQLRSVLTVQITDGDKAYLLTDHEEIAQMMNCLRRTRSGDYGDETNIITLDFYFSGSGMQTSNDYVITDQETYHKLLEGKEDIAGEIN